MALTLIIGGIGSGKSELAETVVKRSGSPRVYIATAVATDPEFSARIRRHRQRRDSTWQTIEEPMAIAGAISTSRMDCTLLLECIPTWLTNHLVNGSNMEDACEYLLEALEEREGETVVVTNEAGCGVIPESPLGREYLYWLGMLNQRLASIAQDVIQVVAGLPIELKRDGQLRH